MPWKADTEAYLFYYSSCPTLAFYFILLFLHESRIKLISNHLFEINIIPSHSNPPSSLPF